MALLPFSGAWGQSSPAYAGGEGMGYASVGLLSPAARAQAAGTAQLWVFQQGTVQRVFAAQPGTLVLLHNALGQQLWQGSTGPEGHDLPSLPAGNYWLKLPDSSIPALACPVR